MPTCSYNRCGREELTHQGVISQELVVDTPKGPIGCFFCTHTCMVMMKYELGQKTMEQWLYEYTLKTCYPKKKKSKLERELDDDLDRLDFDDYDDN